jgi:hypothetical protein
MTNPHCLSSLFMAKERGRHNCIYNRMFSSRMYTYTYLQILDTFFISLHYLIIVLTSTCFVHHFFLCWEQNSQIYGTQSLHSLSLSLSLSLSHTHTHTLHYYNKPPDAQHTYITLHLSVSSLLFNTMMNEIRKEIKLEILIYSDGKKLRD